MLLAPHRRSLLPAVLAALFLAGHAFAGLQARVEHAVKSAALTQGRVSVSVRDVEGGSELVAIDSERPMIPASNFKLLTTGAALDLLGPDFNFTTRLVHDGDRLVVIADGDPAFADPELLELMDIDFETLVDYWVQAVVAAAPEGVNRLVVDDRIFDRQFVHPAWPTDQLNRRYCAEVAGLNVHLNVIHFFPRPTRGTRPDLARHVPEWPTLTIRNRGTNDRGANARSNAWFARPPATNTFTMYGNVKVAYVTPAPVTVHDTPTLFARLLADRLEDAGVAITSSGLVESTEPPTGGVDIGPPIRTPISTVVTRCNRDSQNLYAEVLLKRIAHHQTGRPGSWEEGRAILRHVIRRRVDPEATETVAIDDGSGLSRDNRVAAGAMTAWLDSMHRDERISRVFVDSLALARVSGTLEKRFRTVDLAGTEVRAKSGFINKVSCLSGYVTSPGAATRSFSILVNDLTGPGALPRAKAMQEKIVALIAADMVPAGVSLGSDEFDRSVAVALHVSPCGLKGGRTLAVLRRAGFNPAG